MSNKKRITNKIRAIERKNFNRSVGSFMVASKAFTSASDHMADALGYFATGIQQVKRVIRTFGEFQYGVDFGNQFITPKSLLEMIPAKYNRDFIELVKAGFSEEEAFETLKETYNF